MIEILSPAGNMQNLIASVESGANAVYLGLQDFSARKNSQNFSRDELKYAVAYAKTFNVKTYLTVNTLIKNSELNAVLDSIVYAYNIGVDAFIIQDVFLGKVIKNMLPNAVLHLSTQAGVCNEYGAIQAKRYGFSRVILARETKFEDIKKICKIIETEIFVQGALCTCFSGHCYMSSYIGANSGNRGLCKQPCRKEYTYETTSGKVLKSGYVLSLSDLCLKDELNKYIKAGVTSFKIEGRMRSEEYVRASVLLYKSALNGEDTSSLFNSLKKAYNRGDYTTSLATSQPKNFISSKIQGHKGLAVTTVNNVLKDTFTVTKNVKFNDGDAFKILRDGKEVGNGFASVLASGKQTLKFKGKIRAGDTVSITKDVLLNDNLKRTALKQITVDVTVKNGDYLTLLCEDILVKSSEVLTPSKTQSATKQDVINNLNKVDVYPFKVSVNFKNFDENLFISKGVLNRLRASLYEKLFFKNCLKNQVNIVNYKDFYNFKKPLLNESVKAIITSEVKTFSGYNYIIYSPNNYNSVDATSVKTLSQNGAKVYLYLPPYLEKNDLEIINKIKGYFSGLYINSYWAVEYCKINGIEFFCGVGVNAFNDVDVACLFGDGARLICASKELSLNEIKNVNDGLIVFNEGAIEIMDLIYCPFSKNCADCLVDNEFILKDNENRKFIVERYKLSECRFRIYNSYYLDVSAENFSTIKDLKINYEALGVQNKTKANFYKGVL